MPFLFIFLAYVLTLGALLLAYPKGALELWVNRHVYADSFFFFATYLGDGVLYALVSVSIGVRHRRWGAFALACFALTGLFAQFLKNFIFPDCPRPSAFFEGKEILRLVQGVEMHTSNSFPSGHTTSAFSLGLVLSLYFRRDWASVLFGVLAVVGGFSRVYLMQHFFVDTLFGACIGTLGTLLLYQILKNRLSPPPAVPPSA